MPNLSTHIHEQALRYGGGILCFLKINSINFRVGPSGFRLPDAHPWTVRGEVPNA